MTKQSDRLSHDHRSAGNMERSGYSEQQTSIARGQFGHSRHYESAACTLGNAPLSGLTYGQAETESALARPLPDGRGGRRFSHALVPISRLHSLICQSEWKYPCESRLVIPSVWHYLAERLFLRPGTLNENVHETPRLCGPIVCAARAGDPIDSAQHVHWIDIWPKISASDGAAR